MVKAPASRVEDPGFESGLCQDFSGSSHASDLEIDTPVAILPGAWHCRVSAGTGWPSVSILWLGEMESLMYNFYFSVAACKIVGADPSLRYTSLLLGHLATNQQMVWSLAILLENLFSVLFNITLDGQQLFGWNPQRKPRRGRPCNRRRQSTET